MKKEDSKSEYSRPAERDWFESAHNEEEPVKLKKVNLTEIERAARKFIKLNEKWLRFSVFVSIKKERDLRALTDIWLAKDEAYQKLKILINEKTI